MAHVYHRRAVWAASLATVLVAWSAGPVGAAEYVPEALKKVKKQPHQGWAAKLTIGANLALATNTNVVGQQDGATLNIGGTLSGGANYRRKQHEWRNSLDWKESFSRTPSIARMIKSADQLTFESIYLFRPTRLPWLGPFARFVLDTPILEGHDERAENVDYALPDGTTVNQDRLKLTQAFSPLTLKQSVGAFAKPVDEDAVSVEFRLGFGGMEVFAEDQYSLDDDEDTDPVEVKLLADLVQAGAEATAGVTGALYDAKVSYKAGVEVLIPFINNRADADDRGAFELTNVDFFAKLSFKLVSWASLDYEFRALRKPQLLDEWQLQNNLLLTFSYSLLHPKDEKKEEKK